MSHIDKTYNSLTIDVSGSVSVRTHSNFCNDDEVVVATAREKEYFVKDADISNLPAHYQNAINAFWAGIVTEETTEENG